MCLAMAGVILTASGAGAETVLSVTQTSYDADGRPVCTIARMNPASATADACLIDTPASSDGYDRLSRTVYDADGNVIEIKRGRRTNDPANEEEIYATYAYSQNGVKVMEADANGNVTRMSYDVFDRLKYIMYPSPSTARSNQPCGAVPEAYTGPAGTIGSGGCINPQPYTARTTPAGNPLINPTPYLGTYNSSDFEQYTYDNNDNLTIYRRRNGQTHTYGYDGLNRPWSDTPSQGQAVFTAYDLLGNICDKIFATDNLSYSNDCDARYTGVLAAGIHNTYDKAERLVKARDGNGRVLQYGYNEVSSRTTMTFDDGVVQSYQYNVGQMLTWNGINGTSQGVTPGYDTRGRQISVARPNSTSTSLLYDDLDRVIQIKHDLAGAGTTYDVTWGFSYNALSQLRNTTSDNTRYDYVQTSATGMSPNYDGLNRDATLVGTSAACPSGGYDLSGNLICDGPRTFTYDMDNHLLSSVTSGVSGSNITLTYDPGGRLSSYVKGGSTWQFQYDGSDLVAEYLNGALEKRYLHGLGDDQPFVQFTGSGTTLPGWLYANSQGSIVNVANSSGVTTEFYTYDPWGRSFNEAGGLTYSGTRFRYTGQTVLPDASLYYYKARVYDPGYGRFLQSDPMGSQDDLNLYAYVGADPVNRTDTSGLCGTRIVVDGKGHKRLDGGHFEHCELLNPIDAGKPRGRDTQGSGAYGAMRRNDDGTVRKHHGYDIAAKPGTSVTAPFSGTVHISKVYRNPKDPKLAKYVAVTITSGNRKAKLFYVSPTVKEGDKVEQGQEVGTAQDRAADSPGMTNHIHIELYFEDEEQDPTSNIQERRLTCTDRGCVSG